MTQKLRAVYFCGIVILILVILNSLSNYVFAATPPTLLEPGNNSSTTDTSPKLTWNYLGSCPADTKISCFRVEVDDLEDFSSLNKNTYTNNTSYSPQLSEGKWFWRVKAKDENNNWSDYSQIFSFILTAQAPTSGPSPSPSQSSSTTSTGGDQSPSTTSTSKSTFHVSQVPSTINSTDSFSVNVELTNQQANSQYFLKGAFLKSGSSNYFGKTEVSGNWIKNSQTYSSQFPITTDPSGNWSGNLKLSSDTSDSGFDGGGPYIFKVGKYSSSGSGPVWSNETTININYTGDNESGTGGANPKSPSNSNPTIKPSTLKSSTSPLPKISTSNSKTTSQKKSTLASISGVATSSTGTQTPQPLIVKSDKSPNWWLIGGGFLTLGIGLSMLIYTLRRK